MSEPRIVAVVLIRNEDLFIERVIRNVLDFCDRIHVADHRSTDATPAIVRRLAAQHPKVEYRVVDHPSESHDVIAGTPGRRPGSWVSTGMRSTTRSVSAACARSCSPGGTTEPSSWWATS
jgi:glycosyltransferase involved in cell wall biosynthesis